MSKVNKYIELSTGDWRRQPKYGGRKFEYKTDITMDDAAEVVSFCSRNGLILSDLQINAVSFAHGFISDIAKNNSYAAQQMTPLSILLHFADMMSTKISGNYGLKNNEKLYKKVIEKKLV